MIIDAYDLPSGAVLRGDVCVVGAGAAGITVANELRLHGLRVILLESGGETHEPDTQTLADGEIDDPRLHLPLDAWRLRRLGGTTTAWGGRCLPYDPIDFEQRDWVADSGWPFGLDVLSPYYARAHAYCDLDRFTYRAEDLLPHAPSSMIPGFTSPTLDTEQVIQFSPPTDFGQKYRAAMETASNVTLCLHANAVAIRAQDDGAAIHTLDVATLRGTRFTVEASFFVLAAGALEVTRLLLASNDVHASGLGNHAGLLGAYYGSHPTGYLGPIQFTGRGTQVIWGYEQTPSGVYCRRALSLRPEVQRAHRLLNTKFVLWHPLEEDAAHGSAVLSAKHLFKTFGAWNESSQRLTSVQALRQLARSVKAEPEHVKNLFKDGVSLLRFSAMWTRKRVLAHREVPSLMLPSPTHTYMLHFDAEQVPLRSSRVVLSSDRDTLGMPRLRTEYRFSEQDANSIVRTVQVMDDALRDGGVGRILADEAAVRKRIDIYHVNGHHLGTTRMATTPNEGVVDPECRVFGVDNLYVASGSVFPTTSHANPTLTIVALALRLADHLHTRAALAQEPIAASASS